MDGWTTPFERPGPRRVAIVVSCLFGVYALAVTAMKFVMAGTLSGQGTVVLFLVLVSLFWLRSAHVRDRFLVICLFFGLMLLGSAYATIDLIGSVRAHDTATDISA